MTQHRRTLGSAVFVVIITGVTLSILLISPGKLPSSRAYAQSTNAAPHCQSVSGSLMTNLGAISPAITMGTATGDLRGAVAATILSGPTPGPGGTLVLQALHHWVTEAGDTILFPPAGIKETLTPTAQGGFFGVTTEPLNIAGGTGRFNEATGVLTAFGAVDLNTGHTVFRYSGQVCFAAPGNE